MEAGKRNKLVTVQSPTRTPNSEGEMVITWADSFRIWVGIEPITARETMRSNQLIADCTHVIRTHYTRSLTTDQRMKYVDRGETRYFNILGIVDVKEAHKELEIAAAESTDG